MDLQMNREPKRILVKDQTEQLKEAASKSIPFAHTMALFAKRERTRQQVTLSRLKALMIKEGLQYSGQQLMGVLDTLSKLGFGTLYKDSKGHITALKNIKITLQSIGQVALGEQNAKFQKFSEKTDFKEIQSDSKPIETPIVQKAFDKQRKYPATVNVVIDGKSLAIEIPGGVTMASLIDLIDKAKMSAAPIEKAFL